MFKKIFLITVLSGLVIAPALVLASTVTIQNPLGVTSNFRDVLDSFLDFLFKVALVVAPIMALVGAFYIMTAGADPQRLDRGKKVFIWTGVGFLIILLSNGIVSIIDKLLE